MVMAIPRSNRSMVITRLTQTVPAVIVLLVWQVIENDEEGCSGEDR